MVEVLKGSPRVTPSAYLKFLKDVEISSLSSMSILNEERAEIFLMWGSVV